MALTLKDVAERLQVQPEALRGLLSTNLVAAEKRREIWCLEEPVVERLIQVFRLLRRTYYRIPDGKDTPGVRALRRPEESVALRPFAFRFRERTWPSRQRA